LRRSLNVQPSLHTLLRAEENYGLQTRVQDRGKGGGNSHQKRYAAVMLRQEKHLATDFKTGVSQREISSRTNLLKNQFSYGKKSNFKVFYSSVYNTCMAS
jgi:hypothetical protein